MVLIRLDQAVWGGGLGEERGMKMEMRPGAQEHRGTESRGVRMIARGMPRPRVGSGLRPRSQMHLLTSLPAAESDSQVTLVLGSA